MARRQEFRSGRQKLPFNGGVVGGLRLARVGYLTRLDSSDGETPSPPLRPSLPLLPPSLQRLCGAAVLLEVVLALALFTAAATVILIGVQTAVVAVDRLRLETHAMNLAASVIAEMQMHARSMEAVTEEKLEAPYEAWTLSVEISPLDSEVVVETLNRVEVEIRHASEPVVIRLAQILRTDDQLTEDQRQAISNGTMGGGETQEVP